MYSECGSIVFTELPLPNIAPDIQITMEQAVTTDSTGKCVPLCKVFTCDYSFPTDDVLVIRMGG